MAELGGEGDHTVVHRGRGQREAPELARGKKGLQALEDLDALEVVHALGGHNDHRGALEHGRARVGETGVLGSRHGVAADEGPAAALCDSPALLADDALHAHRVDDDGAVGDEACLLGEPINGGLRVARKHDELAGRDGLVVELSAHGLDLGELERALRAVPGVDVHSRGTESPREGAAHEAEPDDAHAARNEAVRRAAFLGRALLICGHA